MAGNDDGRRHALPGARLLAVRQRRRADASPPQSGSDALLAEAMVRRDPQALELLQRDYGSLLLGYVTSIVGDRATAEDVLQVTMIELWERAPRYDPARGSVLAWTITIARSRALDHLRRRVPQPCDPATVASLRDGAAASGDASERLVEQSRVAQLLRRLPTTEAGMLRMRFQLGMSQREIAAQTDMPLGTVKMRMVQSLRRLRDAIEAEEVGAAR